MLNENQLFNREISWLRFNERVLALAQDERLPLLERVRFLAISCSNLDEFFEVRVARLKQAITHNVSQLSADGLSQSDNLQQVAEHGQQLVSQQYQTLNQQLIPALQAHNMAWLQETDIDDNIDAWMQTYFRQHVLPALSPIGLDPTRPFPKILNKTLNYIVRLKGKDAYKRQSRIAVVRAPRSLPRIIQLPSHLAQDSQPFVFLTTIVKRFIAEAFAGMQIESCHQFRVTRNSHLFVDDEDMQDLKTTLQGQLASRGYGAAVRLELNTACSQADEQFLQSHFKLNASDVFRVPGPVNLHRLMALYPLVDRPELKFTPFSPKNIKPKVSQGSLFDRLQRKEVLLHHPYDAFQTVIDWLSFAARDPQVIAIKQTLYRTLPDSDIVGALCDAARAGKEVTAVVELRARFDEAHNIHLADKLQEAGVHVVYGVVGLKIHSKMLLIVRNEQQTLKRYVHLGTGNYHPDTAKMYTDFSLLSANPDLSQDVHQLFMQITGLGKSKPLIMLRQSPHRLQRALLKWIGFEIEQAKQGLPARIIAKMNALIEPSVIHALYQASQAGVQIDLLVRGICALRPGVKGLSDHIRVQSLVGRFLEHSRVYYFEHAGKQRLYCSSADWMDRNLYRRIETAFPITDKKHKKTVLRILEAYLKDDSFTWQLDEHGHYHRRQGNTVSAQDQFI